MKRKPPGPPPPPPPVSVSREDNGWWGVVNVLVWLVGLMFAVWLIFRW